MEQRRVGPDDRGHPVGGGGAVAAPAAGRAPRGAGGAGRRGAHGAGPVLRARAAWLRPGPHRRWRAAADPSGPGALRGALRQPRGVPPPLDRGPRDAGHRRLPPAGLAGPDLGAAGRQRRRRDPPARAARATSRWSVTRRVRASPHCSGRPTSSSSASGSTRSTQLPAVEDFLPGPEVAGELERDLQSALGLGVEAASDDT